MRGRPMRWWPASASVVFMLGLIACGLGCSCQSAPGTGPSPPDPRAHVRIAVDRAAATVSDRFLSVAIDTAQLVGGEFWDPGNTTGGGTAIVPAFDFTRARLASLAEPLGHAWLRIGGTDADRTFYDLGEQPVQTPPANYKWVLRRAAWDAASAFAARFDFKMIFTLNAGPGPRADGGAWQPDNARALVSYATAQKSPVGVWELGNEIDAYTLIFHFTVAPADYALDLSTARALISAVAPGARIAGPSSAYWPIIGDFNGYLPALLKVNVPALDLVTWHYYPQESQRCPVVLRSATPTTLLDPDNLDEIDRWADQVTASAAANRDTIGAEVWLDETSNAQCGGQPGVSNRFVSSLWWLDQLAKLARRGVPVVVRQSLTGADYGLVEEPSLNPRPDYFSSVLFHRLMGPRVLAATAAGPVHPATLRSYAHCAAATAATAPIGAAVPAGAVVALLINLDTAPITVALDTLPGDGATVWLLSAPALDAPAMSLNQTPLTLDPDGKLPSLAGAPATPGALVLPPTSSAFLLLPNAHAPACP